jgi:transcriptional regulator with XRE-family HTH domain
MRDKGGTAFRDDFGDATRRGIGQNITDVRRARDLSQEELAKRVKISMRTLNRIETGSGNATLNVLIAIAAELSVDVADLMTRRRISGQQLLVLPQRDVDALIRISDQAKRERGRTGK